MMMIELLVLLLVAILAFWIASLMPYPIDLVIKILIAVVIVIKLLSYL